MKVFYLCAGIEYFFLSIMLHRRPNIELFILFISDGVVVTVVVLSVIEFYCLLVFPSTIPVCPPSGSRAYPYSSIEAAICLTHSLEH
jgi:hypothetical protein